MIDVNAVREGTRWSYVRREVEVTEVSAQYVIFHEVGGFIAEVTPLKKFVACARDPSTADYEDVLRELEKCARTPADQQAPGVQECLLRDAVIHLLKRLGPPAPQNAVPVPVPAKPEPVVMPAEPDIAPDCGVIAPDCAVAVPDVEPSIGPNDTLLAPYAKPRSKPGSWVA